MLIVLEQPVARARVPPPSRRCSRCPPAWRSRATRFRGATSSTRLFLSPLIIPHLVLGVALLRMFALVGGTGSFGWLIFAHALIVTPYTLRLVVAAVVGFDRSTEQAALSLGASQATVFRASRCR